MSRPDQRTEIIRAVNIACDALAAAQLDARSRGYTTGTGPRSPGHADPTYRATLKANVADVWLAKFGQAVEAIFHAADQANRHWPPQPAAGTTIDGITIGGRTNDVELCAECHQPAPSGRDESGNVLIHRVQVRDRLVSLHASSCYYRLDRRARAAGQTIAAYLTAQPQNA